MKKFFLFAVAALLLSSCNNDEAASDASFAMKASGADYADQCSKPRVVISGDLTTAQTWSNTNVYVLSGVVRVKTALTIQAGTYIIADPSVTTGANGVLVITKAGTINAVGTVGETCSPIVFTSWKLLDCDAATVPAAGDFGGVVLLGEAVVNNGLTTNVIEGLGDQSNVEDFHFGGTNDSDNSGTMSYVRIEYAGRILDEATGVEINGLTFGAVGSGTTINHIQVSWGLDDAYEWFGGTVSATHLVAFSNDDDSFDFDWGYTGSITKAIAVANTNSTHSKSGSNPDSNGIELDNNSGGTVTTLITRPVISELSIIGFQCPDQTALENGIHIRRRGQIVLQDATVTGYPVGIKWESPSLADDSSWTTLSVHAPLEANVILPTATDLGFTSSRTFGCPMETWGLTQPFYNVAGFNLGGSTGAFTSETGWTSCWTKF